MSNPYTTNRPIKINRLHAAITGISVGWWIVGVLILICLSSAYNGYFNMEDKSRDSMNPTVCVLIDGKEVCYKPQELETETKN